MTIANKIICLNLNANWQAVGMKSVKDAIIDLCGGNNNGKPTCLALDIEYNLDDAGEPMLSTPKSIVPTPWDVWITLPIRPWDLFINSPSSMIRVPTVIISTNFNKMPVKQFKGKPSKDAIYRRDNGICQYSGRKLEKSHATVDHAIPRSKGGKDTWTNLVLCAPDINSKKGNKLNSEVGLKLIRQPTAPAPIPVSALIKEAKHVDWMPFITM